MNNAVAAATAASRAIRARRKRGYVRPYRVRPYFASAFTGTDRSPAAVWNP